jgi:ATP-dependent DNA helicase DinG
MAGSGPLPPAGPDPLEGFWAPDGPLARTLTGYEPRPQQAAMARAVAQALDHDRTLLVEAGTGTGKTLAYLIPAVLSGKKVIVSTGTKALQDQLATHDVPMIEAALDRRLNWCVMKGRENYLCLYRHDQERAAHAARPVDTGDAMGWSRGSPAPLDAIARWSEITETGDRVELPWLGDDDPLWRSLSVTAEQCLGTACPRFEPCFLTQLKRRAAQADVVIVNHALFFADLALAGRASGSILPHHTAVICDEAHGLEDVAASHWGVTLSRARVLDLLADLRREPMVEAQAIDLPAWSRTLDRLRAATERAFDVLRASGGPNASARTRWMPEASHAGVAAGAELVDRLVVAAERMREWAARAEGWTRLAERVSAVAADARVLWRAEDPSYVYFVEPAPSNPKLTASPLDVSDLLRSALFGREAPRILTSATLTVCGEYAYLKSRIGIDEADELVLASPFDYAAQTLLYVPVHLPHPRDLQFPDAAADEIVRVVAASGGRAFLLFTSRRMLDAVHERCRARMDYLVLKQGEAPRMTLIERFKVEAPAVLFATMGFWQGIDVPGEALSCVVLDKLPFAPPDDPLVQARLNALRRRGEDPFTAYQLPAAAMWLKQGMGRLIRTRRDRGAICVLDARLVASWYGAFFLDSLPPSPVTTRFADLERFYAVEREAADDSSKLCYPQPREPGAVE